MRRVVVTGMGIVSSIGNNTQEVLASLREAKSGVVRADKYAELGFRCHVHGAPTLDASEAADIARSKGPKRVGPFAVPKAMSSTASATLATWFKIKGLSYSISSACATSNHCIGAAYEHILAERQDVMFAGSSEELDWTLSVLFDAMGAMSSGYND